ncbi:MAG: 2-amino-4-hydroxy-6-hydroxymethyldihydropteridine diphosphokinase [Microthrixaceae bacterium]
MRAFLGLGSNLGDRRAHLLAAVESLPCVVAESDVFETAPVGGPRQDAFLNMVVELDTDLDPTALLGVCHRLEAAAHRVRRERWGPRTLDVDIIWIDGVTVESPVLQVPHPRWKQRRFVLAPLRQLAPDLVSEQDVELSDGAVSSVGPLR